MLTDNHLVQAGRKFYGICIAVTGIQQLVWISFLPVIVPGWPSFLFPQVFACISGALLLWVSYSIIFERNARTTSLIFGSVLLMLFLLGHVPHQFIFNPYYKHLGVWGHAFKTLALAGGAFLVAGSYESEKKSGVIAIHEKLIPYGRVFFSTTMIVFGIVHFLYAENVATLVPNWIPGQTFWTYFSAIALIGAGTAIIFKIKIRLVAILLGVMIFLWFIILHLPRAVADPVTGLGNEVTSAFQALGFSGIAFLIAYRNRTILK